MSDELDREQKLIETTRSYQKTLNYIKGLLDDQDFQGLILKLRKKYDLPDNGLSEVQFSKAHDGKTIVISYPERFETEPMLPFQDDLNKLAADYGLDFLWGDLLRHYIVYNSLDLAVYTAPMDIVDLTNLIASDIERDSFIEYLKYMSTTHPIAIIITPYASQRDIVDYVKKLYGFKIKPMQDTYKKPGIMIGKIRKRNETVRMRNRFIYENRKLSSKQIQRLVAEKFHQFLDYTYINKIIADKTKEKK